MMNYSHDCLSQELFGNSPNIIDISVPGQNPPKTKSTWTKSTGTKSTGTKSPVDIIPRKTKSPEFGQTSIINIYNII